MKHGEYCEYIKFLRLLGLHEIAFQEEQNLLRQIHAMSVKGEFFKDSKPQERSHGTDTNKPL